MAYQVLARKWRPQDFASLVGQEAIVQALRNALRDGRIAQAYLFSGIRGVGKTTAARVLAKALNCENGPATDPCNVCPTCIEITAGSCPFVREVDAATYSKVEQVRELVEVSRDPPDRSNLAPEQKRYRVVVLDEVHRLSRQAFDALLKVVEEPPPYLVFIFATTEIDAVPATILSRCQEFQFRRVSGPVLAAYLRSICSAESIEATDVSLRLIARAGEGSVRDSVALLDQLATFGNGVLDDADVKRLLGGQGSALFAEILDAILAGEPRPILESLREIESNGWDPHNVFCQFLAYVRDGLHLALGAPPDSTELPLEEAELLAKKVRPGGHERLLQLLKLLLQAEASVRRSELGLLALEIAWLRAAELPKVVRVEELLGAGLFGSEPPGGTARPLARAENRERPGYERPGHERPGLYERSPPERPFETAPPQDLERAAPNLERGRDEQSRLTPSDVLPREDQIPQWLDLVGTRAGRLAALLRPAALFFEDRVLLIEPPAGDKVVAETLQRSTNALVVTETLTEFFGPGIEFRVLSGGASALAPSVKESSTAPGPGRPPAPKDPSPVERPFVATPRPAEPRPAEPRPAEPREAEAPRREPGRSEIKVELEQHPTVQKVLEIFGGRIRAIRNEGDDQEVPS